MRFGISTHLYHDRPLGPEQLNELAEFGFRRVELFATLGHFDYHDPAAIAALAGWLRDAGLELHSVHGPIVEHNVHGEWGAPLSTAAAAEDARKHAVREAFAALEIARQIPFKFFVVHLGVPDDLNPPAASNAALAAERSLLEIARAAAPLGVQVAVEVIPNKLSAAHTLVRLVEDELELDPPGLAICLDLGHAFLMGDLADAIEIVAGELVTTHVHDNRGKNDDHLVPFDGNIDWPTALMSLEKVGYEGLIMFELANTSTPREVLQKTVSVRRRFEEIPDRMKIGFVSLGCPKNLVDSEVMLGLAREAGHTLTPDADEADVLVVNTCAFIESARQESVNAILEMAAHKTDGRCKRLVVTGCMAERYRDELKKEIPEIDAVLGTGEVPGIVAAVEGPLGAPSALPRSLSGTAAVPMTLHRRPAPPQPAGESPVGALAPRGTDTIARPGDYLYDDRTPRTLTTPSHFAYVKIGEGCNYKCAFCIIPKLRGPYRSRPSESIVQEARNLAAQGVKELLLISQDSTYFGNNRGERGALARLLRELNQVDGLEWIRLLYLYPTTITTETLTAIAECDKVCKYVDLPLQHASDSVLKRMRRPGTRASYVRLIEKIRHTVPGVTLRTTFIVGFPGETEREFETLRRFVETVGFDHVGVFTYSHEEGTSAGRLDDDVPARVKKQRQRTLMAMQQRIVAAANKRRVGERVRVLVDGPSPEHPLVIRGRLAGQAPDIDPVVYLSETDPSLCPAGAMLEAEVVAARGYDLVVRPLPPALDPSGL